MNNLFSKIITGLMSQLIPFGFRQTSAHTYMIYYTEGCIMVNESVPSVRFLSMKVPMANSSFEIPLKHIGPGSDILSYISNREDKEFGRLINKALRNKAKSAKNE